MKNRRGGIFLRASGWCTTKLCATIRRNPYSAKLLRRANNASMGEWSSLRNQVEKYLGSCVMSD
jgi:hypothetical protein